MVTGTSDRDIGANLQRLRRDMSQTALAEAMKRRGHKWSQPTVVAVEKGERPLRYAEALDASQILGVSVDVLGNTPAAVELSTAWQALDDARSALELSAARYENARLQVKYAIMDALDSGIVIPRSADRDGWVEETPERVIAEMRSADETVLIPDVSLREYLDHVAKWDTGGEPKATT